MVAWVVLTVTHTGAGRIEAPDQRTALALARAKYGRNVSVQSVAAHDIERDETQAIDRERSRARRRVRVEEPPEDPELDPES